MSVFKKTKLLILSLITALVLAGCTDPNGGTPEEPVDSSQFPTLDYNKAVYTIPMAKALEASNDFVKKSIKAEVNRGADLSVSEEDTWQGYIDSMWNVPSNIYGTSSTLANNKLVINNEELGTLQPLVHSTDENGNFRKAVFEYKGYLYYVLDKNNSYVVISTADDFEHLIVDQKGKIGTKDWSNFKIWVWEKNSNGELYKRGNLGYAYTLRNIKMQDGSYATITVAGYNYYNYGFRVWIQETEGNTEKEELPADSGDYHYDNAQVPSIPRLETVSENEDFIYEVVNKTSGKLTIKNYIRNYTIKNFDEGILAVTDAVVLEKDETYQFKYSVEKLLKYDQTRTTLGCYFTPERKWQCGGWENNINYANQIHTVTVTDSDEYCMNGENSWKFINTTKLEENKDLYNFIYKVVNNTSGELKIANYLGTYKNFTGKFIAISDDIVLKKGEFYEFKYNLTNVKTLVPQEDINCTYLGGLFTPEGKGLSWGWENNLTRVSEIHTVTVTDSDIYNMNGKESWEYMETTKFNENKTDYDFVYKVVNNSSASLSVKNYLMSYTTEINNFLGFSDVVTLEPGKSYEFKYKLSELQALNTDENAWLNLGIYYSPKDGWFNWGWDTNLYQQNKVYTITITGSLDKGFNLATSWSDF